MKPTDELCRMLDERGVEYTQTIVTEGVMFTIVTSKEHYFILVRDNDAGIEMWSQYFTPAQAIAATLGDTNLAAENAKLREELAKARDPQRIGGQADRSSFVYAIEQLREFRWQHATNDEDAIPYINNVAAAHERESAKLRELAKEAMNVAHVLCGENLAPCDVCGVDKCGTGCKLECIDKLARELGIEVDE